MHSENNQTILLENYLKIFKSTFKEYLMGTLLISLLIVGVVFAIIFAIFNPSVSFFTYVLIGIAIIFGLEYFSMTNIINIIDKVKKTMHAYNLDEFKHEFRKAFKQQQIKDIKIYIPIYLLIIGILTHIHFAYYPEDIWFIPILVIIGIFILVTIISPSSDEFIKIVEKDINEKLEISLTHLK